MKAEEWQGGGEQFRISNFETGTRLCQGYGEAKRKRGGKTILNESEIMSESEKPYALEERTARFGESVIRFCRSFRQDAVMKPLISQIVRSATSVGANYCEANGASSKKGLQEQDT